MADKLLESLTLQNPVKTTDLIYLVDPSQTGAAKDRYAPISGLLAISSSSVIAVPTMSDASYVMWEKGTAYTVIRLVDGFLATITNNPTKTTATQAWTDRATLTYSATGT